MKIKKLNHNFNFEKLSIFRLGCNPDGFFQRNIKTNMHNCLTLKMLLCSIIGTELSIFRLGYNPDGICHLEIPLL